MSKKAKDEVKKSRYWAFVIYPDSMPSNWEEIIRMSGKKIAISPLHDSDINADETQKKPHYHIIAVWKNPTTYNSALSLSKELGGTIPQEVRSVSAYYRYFCHLDNPEKAQYDETEIRTFNEFNILEYVENSQREMCKKIMDIIDSDKINSYNSLLKNLRFTDELLLDYAVGHTLWIKEYIISNKYNS